MKVVLAIPYTNNPSWGNYNFAYNITKGLMNFCHELEKQEIEITILSSARETLNCRMTPTKCSNLNILYYHQIPPLTIFSGVQNVLLGKIRFKNILLDSDIIHSHDVLFSLSMAKLFRNKPLIHTVLGLPWNEKEYLNSKYQRFSNKSLINKYKELTKLMNVKFIAISQFVATDIQDNLGISEERINIIYVPIDDDLYKVKKDENPMLIFYPARLIPRKNHLPLIEAIGILKNKGYNELILALTGKVEDIEYFTRINTLIRKYDLNDRIIFLGDLPRRELFEWYSKASVVVLTSLEESFSLSIAESMATGTPILASPVGIIPEIVINNVNGLIIDPTDPLEISNKLEILLSDKKLREKMGNAAKKSTYSFKSKKIAEDIISLWKNCVVK